MSSTASAVASPPPMHSEATPRLFPWFARAASSVTTMRVKGIPVATFAIGAAGAANAALFAVAMLANEDADLRAKLEAYRTEQTNVARHMTLPPAI